MTGADLKSGDSPQEEESSESLGGERIAIARQELELSISDIAKELHLDEYKVMALERNDFDAIGAPVFAKGHLRKYAQLVKLDVAEVMADYYKLTRQAGTPPVVLARRRPVRPPSIGLWLVVVALLIIAAAAYWWLFARDEQVARPATNAIRALPAEPETVPEEEETTADIVEESVPPESEPVAETVSDSQPEPPAEMALSLSYSGDCWTEISDANGASLFFSLGTAGQRVELSGQAPFNVLFGDAANVIVRVNDMPYDISDADRRGRTARMTITEP